MGQKFSKTSSSGQVVLYGKHAVFAALKNPNREVLRLMLLKENETEFKKEFAGVSYQIGEKKDIEKLVGANAVHQGYALVTKPLRSMFLEDLIEQTSFQKKCHVLILDQVTDPQNVGAIVRSAAAFNATAVIVQDKNSPQESGAMAKASAGTIELMPMVRVTNLARAIESLKKAGFWIVGMDGYAKQKIEEVDKNSKLAVIMGNEGSGMRRLVEESCDIRVRLEINEKVESLNVSTAAAIVLYELNK